MNTKQLFKRLSLGSMYYHRRSSTKYFWVKKRSCWKIWAVWCKDILSILVCAQVNMWKDVHLCWETFGGIHHGSKTHISLSKAICELDLILLSAREHHPSNPPFSPALSKFPSLLNHSHQCANMPVFISTTIKNKTYNKRRKSLYKHLFALFLQ